MSATVNLTAGIFGAPPLFLLPDGRISNDPARVPEAGPALLGTLVSLARWISSRRTSTFARLFPPSAFHPEQPVRHDRLSAAQAERLLAQLRAALQAAAGFPEEPAELRSAVLTALSHIVATVLDDPSYRAVADAAAGEIFALIDREQGPAARPALRAHAIFLLQLRGPALSEKDRERARALLRGLFRAAPPYAELPAAWNFAMCSDADFHAGEVDILRQRHHFRDAELPADAPAAPGGAYTVLEAPFKNPRGGPIRVFARPAWPRDENQEMAREYFVGLLVNRHAQLGSFDMEAAAIDVRQAGYKLMMNSQCAGLTTRFAISKLFPDADIYSSWDSTFFSTDSHGKVTRSEGADCFVALLGGMAAGEDHAQLEERIRRAQWEHRQMSFPGFVQFVGPSHPEVLARFSDVNQDGHADFYDGFLDFDIRAIGEDMKASATPRDPGVAATQIGGAAARGLDWAAGSLNRMCQYSDLWSALAGDAELLYPFQAGGFYSQREPARDVPLGRMPLKQDPALLPALCRYVKDPAAPAGFFVDVLFHGFLSHSAEELKRLLCAAEAFWRALDLGYLPAPPDSPLHTPLGQRGALLLMLAGLLEFPADQNFIDGLWAIGLEMLNFPPLSRTLVRGCITQEDHDADNYYGSQRGLRQLCLAEDGGALRKADPAAYEKLKSAAPAIGRAAELKL